MNKKLIILMPFIVLALAGCPSGSDSGDSGIDKVTINPNAPKTPAAAAMQNNPNIPQTAKNAIPGGK